MRDMNIMHPSEPGSPATDAQAVLDHVISGTPIDPLLANRVRERAEAIRREILAKHGVQEIGVEIIRELRGELPES
jgi:hypothetical protein